MVNLLVALRMPFIFSDVYPEYLEFELQILAILIFLRYVSCALICTFKVALHNDIFGRVQHQYVRAMVDPVEHGAEDRVVNHAHQRLDIVYVVHLHKEGC